MLLNITYIFYIHDSFLFLVILIILRDTLLPGPLGSLSPRVYAVELPGKRLLVTNKMCVWEEADFSRILWDFIFFLGGIYIMRI